MWLYLVLVAGMVLCGTPRAARARRLIVSVLWLAGVSVLVAVILSVRERTTGIGY